MLGSYSKLSRDQIEEYYGKINVLAKEHPNIAYDLENFERAKMYYAMATNNYSEAIKIIKGKSTTKSTPHTDSSFLKC